MRRRAWLTRRARGPRVYHVDPDCGSRYLRELAETTEARARKIARLCRTCRRVHGPYEDRWRHTGIPAR